MTSVFNWTSTHNVLEVTSKAEYDSCTKTNGIPKETSPVTITLTANGTLYFICTIATHCTLGQKVTIKVGNGVSTSPPPSNSANPPFTISAFWPLLSAILMYFFASPAHIVYWIGYFYMCINCVPLLMELLCVSCMLSWDSLMLFTCFLCFWVLYILHVVACNLLNLWISTTKKLHVVLW